MMGFFNWLFDVNEDEIKATRKQIELDKEFIAHWQGEEIFEYEDLCHIVVNYEHEQILIHGYGTIAPITNRKFVQNKPYLYRIISFKDLIDVELQINNQTITVQNGSVTRALIGGALFGIGGAIVGGISGGSTSKEYIKNGILKIIIDDLREPFINVLCAKETKSQLLDSKYINNAVLCVEKLRAIIRKYKR